MHEYLRLIGPGILAALASVSALVVVDPVGATSLHIGVEAVAVLVCVAVVAWRRNLLLGLLAAVWRWWPWRARWGPAERLSYTRRPCPARRGSTAEGASAAVEEIDIGSSQHPLGPSCDRT